MATLKKTHFSFHNFQWLAAATLLTVLVVLPLLKPAQAEIPQQNPLPLPAEPKVSTSTPTIVPSPSNTPLPTATPNLCPSPYTIGNITIYFDDIPDKKCPEIIRRIQLTEEWARTVKGWTIVAEVYVGNNPESLAQKEFDARLLLGCITPPSGEQQKEQWKSFQLAKYTKGWKEAQGAGGFTFPFYTDPNGKVYAPRVLVQWSVDYSTFTHELIHTVQLQAYQFGGPTPVNLGCESFGGIFNPGFPEWEARFYEEMFAQQYDITFDPGDIKKWCANISLQQATSVGGCIFMLGAKALQLAEHACGEDKGMTLWHKLATGSTREAAFLETYGISLSVFYQKFAAFRGAKSDFVYKTPQGTPGTCTW